jgi:hypothetical protein
MSSCCTQVKLKRPRQAETEMPDKRMTCKQKKYNWLAQKSKKEKKSDISKQQREGTEEIRNKKAKAVKKKQEQLVNPKFKE